MPAAAKTLWGFFPTYRKSTGLQADAGSLPGVTLYKNGTATADSVTVSKVATGLYKWTSTLSGADWSDKDILEALAAITDADAVAETVPVDRREIHWQTVDETYTRIGAPVGATISADIAAKAAAATALSNAVWTDAKAGYLTGAVALEATLTAIKGAGWSTETLAAIDALIDAIKAKTDNLPASPASEGNVSAVGVAVLTRAAPGAQMDLVDAPNAVARTALATSVWASATRTLTSFGTLVADAATAVWAAAARTLTSFGTVGTDTALARKLLQNKLVINLAESRADLYADDGVTIYATAALTDSNGNDVTASTTGPINRGPWEIAT